MEKREILKELIAIQFGVTSPNSQIYRLGCDKLRELIDELWEDIEND